MEYQNYEDYMKQVLGYSSHNPNIYESYNHRNRQPYEDTYYRNDMPSVKLSENEINDFYPEIYRLVHPMVCKVCDTNTEPITKELVEKMTDEVYTAIGDTETVVNVRIETKKTESIPNSSGLRRTGTRVDRTPRRIDENRLTKVERTEKQPKDNRGINNNTTETRRDSTLRDLIKILILQQLLGGNKTNHSRLPRQPFQGEPGMPPNFPTRPPFPRGGPPISNPPLESRDYTDYLKF